MSLLWLIPILPLLAAAINGIVGKRLPKNIVGFIGAGSVLGSFLISANAFREMMQIPVHELPIIKNYFTWIRAGSFEANFGFMLDHLSGLMILIVTGVGF